MRITEKKNIFVVAALIAAAAVCILFHLERRTQAQDEIHPPPVPDRISFGMVGITAGQTLRASVTYTVLPNDVNLPPGPTRVVLNFRLNNGQLARNPKGEVIRKVVDLERGDSTFLDLNYDELPPGPIRLQLRPVVTVIPPPVGDSSQPPPVGDRTAVSLEVISNSNGRTVFALSSSPAIQRVQPPPTDD